MAEAGLPAVRQLADCQFRLGEGPVWDADRQLLWCVDIKRQRLWQYDPATGSARFFDAPAPVGWALPAENGQLLCGLKDGLYLFDVASQQFDWLMAVPEEPAGNRLNDACTDGWGRVWFGSMDDAEAADSGRFYCFGRGVITPAGPSGIAITNGPAVSPDGGAASGRIYFTDTLGKRIMVGDLSAAGVSDVRLFVDTAAHFPHAYPDGPVVDGEGYVWTGLYLGSCVARFAPDGTLVDHLAMPARDITKLTFGGPDLRTGFVTTATKDLTPDQQANSPLAGSLLAFDAPVSGALSPLVKLG